MNYRDKQCPQRNCGYDEFEMAVEFTFDRERAAAAVVYLAAQHIPDLSKGKICKLIFLADKHHLVRFGRPVTGDRICAMKDGPVPSNILTMLNRVLEDPGNPTVQLLSQHIFIDRQYIHPHFQAERFTLAEFLSESDIDSLRETVERFGGKTFSELRSMTHEMGAYKNAWEDRVNNAPDMAFEDLFEDDDDALEGAREQMIETDSMRKVFGAAF
jgi:uncharacterized phage-associated protein